MTAQQPGKVESRGVKVNDLLWFMRFSTNPVPDGAPSIVLVHGYAVSSLYMIPLARALAPDYRVYAPDLPGYGNSERPGHVPRLPELADGLTEWMDIVDLERAIFIGNSFGSQIIAELALRHPERLDAAILIGPTFDPSGGIGPGQLGRLLIDVTREPLSVTLVQTWDYLRFGPRRLILTYFDMLHDELEAKMPRITCPILITRGERDPITTSQWTHRLASLAPRGRHAIIPNAAHAANYTAPNELRRIVQRFLDEPTLNARGKPSPR